MIKKILRSSEFIQKVNQEIEFNQKNQLNLSIEIMSKILITIPDKILNCETLKDKDSFYHFE